MKINLLNPYIPSMKRTASNLYGQIKTNSVNFSFCGKTDKVTKVNLIDNETRQNVSADLIEKPYNGCYMTHEIKVDGKKVGYANISVFPKTVNVPFIYRENGFLYVKNIENKSKGKYKYIGTELLKSVVQRSDEMGFEGRVALCAAKNAHCFHYKFGFEPVLSNISGKRIRGILESESKKENPSTQYLGFIDMYLPQKRIEEILCK